MKEFSSLCYEVAFALFYKVLAYYKYENKTFMQV